MLIQDMPALGTRQPNAEQQAEFTRQLEILINHHKSYPSIVTWVSTIYTPIFFSGYY
jgi:hypothetical protein